MGDLCETPRPYVCDEQPSRPVSTHACVQLSGDATEPTAKSLHTKTPTQGQSHVCAHAQMYESVGRGRGHSIAMPLLPNRGWKGEEPGGDGLLNASLKVCVSVWTTKQAWPEGGVGMVLGKIVGAYVCVGA